MSGFVGSVFIASILRHRGATVLRALEPAPMPAQRKHKTSAKCHIRAEGMSTVQGVWWGPQNTGAFLCQPRIQDESQIPRIPGRKQTSLASACAVGKHQWRGRRMNQTALSCPAVPAFQRANLLRNSHQPVRLWPPFHIPGHSNRVGSVGERVRVNSTTTPTKPLPQQHQGLHQRRHRCCCCLGINITTRPREVQALPARTA